MCARELDWQNIIVTPWNIESIWLRTIICWSEKDVKAGQNDSQTAPHFGESCKLHNIHGLPMSLRDPCMSQEYKDTLEHDFKHLIRSFGIWRQQLLSPES
jgi:hypothetical protein